MTSTPEPPREPAGEGQPQRPPRQSRRQPQQAPGPAPDPAALDPRLLRQERDRRRQRSNDAGLKVVGLAAFVFGVALHGCVAVSFLADEGQTVESVAATPTQLAEDAPSATPPAPPTATPLPDRTSCEEIRGTQYRSVTEREFFLANCTS